jgi:hypothetical protein
MDQVPVPRRFPSQLLILLLGGISLLLWYTPHWLRERAFEKKRNAWKCMRLLSHAEADFREQDRDGNKVQDFWTGDVAGLYRYGLIPRELAEADAAPLTPLVPKPVPYKGFLFKAMILDRSETPPVSYRQQTDKTSGQVHHPSRFGFVAFPADSEERYFLIINENNSIFPTTAFPTPPEDFPTDDHLKSYYSKVGG